MIIDGYVVPDGTEIEEFKTKQGHVFYACNGSVALSKEGALRYVASGKVCECGAHTLTSWSDLCLKCQHKLQLEKYLKIPCVPYHGQPVFVGDDYTEDLEQCLDDQLNDFTLDEVLTFEIMEAVPMKVPEFGMNDFLEDYLGEDMTAYTGYDHAINALIRAAADPPVFTYGKNRVEIPAEWIAKHLEAE